MAKTYKCPPQSNGFTGQEISIWQINWWELAKNISNICPQQQFLAEDFSALMVQFGVSAFVMKSLQIENVKIRGRTGISAAMDIHGSLISLREWLQINYSLSFKKKPSMPFIDKIGPARGIWIWMDMDHLKIEGLCYGYSLQNGAEGPRVFSWLKERSGNEKGDTASMRMAVSAKLDRAVRIENDDPNGICIIPGDNVPNDLDWFKGVLRTVFEFSTKP